MLPKRFVVLALVTVISLVAIGWISARSTRVMGETVDSLDHTREVLQQIEQFRGALAAAESSARGYVITGVPSFSNDFQHAASSMRQSLARLKTLATNDEREQASLTALDALIVSRLEVFQSQVSPRGAQAAPSEIVLKGTMASRKMGEILDSIQSEELGHFRQRVSRAEVARRFAIYGPWSMCLIAVIILSLLVAERRRYAARARLMRDDLKSAVLKEHTARQSAEEADAMKNQFLATVSHELRTPLTSIIGWCGLLSDVKVRDTLLDEGLASIAQAGRVQSQLVEDLLDVSRIIAGRLEPRLSEVNAVDFVQAAITSVAPSARAKGITITTSVQGQPQALHADATRLEQVVWNLLSNAIKFTPANGTIGIALRFSASHLEISVTDNGEGMGPDLLPYIFDRFRQGQPTGTRKGGLGLGLSIVKSLVELHGGTVRAESGGVGAGSTFIVDLPLAVVGKSKEATPAAELQLSL